MIINGLKILRIALFLILMTAARANAQFAPAAGIEGTTAIHADSSVFIAWACAGTLERGFMDVTQPEMGLATFGSEASACGKADLNSLSLGDGGVFTYYFEIPLIDGPGPDFAVFENSFSDNFLELAHVEVSTDGQHFVRFSSVSLTDFTNQLDGFASIETAKIHNLAGKYRGLYGTPFDLAELDDPDLNRNKVHYIRIIDVVGCVDPLYGTRDGVGNMINDPWPTPFPSSGFDLDALGVIYDQRYSRLDETRSFAFQLGPNPFEHSIQITDLRPHSSVFEIEITDIQGKTIFKHTAKSGEPINTSWLIPGIYLVKVFDVNEVRVQKMVKK